MIEVPEMPTPEDRTGGLELGPHPSWENNKELKALNEKMDRVIQLLSAMNGHLVSIKAQTQPSGFPKRGFRGQHIFLE